MKYADDSEIKRKGRYVGQFNGEDQYHGFGRMAARGFIYEGMWENGERDGWGRLIQANGTYYEGYFKDNMFDGKGKLCILALRMGKIGDYISAETDISEFFVKKNFEIKEGEFQLGSFESTEIDNYNFCFEKI